MSGRFLPTAYAKPSQPFYTSYTGGGGGGGTNFGDITVSSITFTGNPETPNDITFPAGYAANVSVDTITLQSSNANYYGINLTDNGGSNATIGLQGQSQGWSWTVDGDGNSAMYPNTASTYFSFSNLIPDLYRAQFLDHNTPLPSPNVANIIATPAGFQMLDENLSSFALSVSSINVSSINGYDASKLISSIVGTW